MSLNCVVVFPNCVSALLELPVSIKEKERPYEELVNKHQPEEEEGGLEVVSIKTKASESKEEAHSLKFTLKNLISKSLSDDMDEEVDKRNIVQKQRKKMKNKRYELDEDDYEVLRENNARPKLGSSKFKRLRKAWTDTEEVRQEEKMDEMAAFIVHDDNVDENGEPVRRRKVNKKKSGQAPGVSSHALDDFHAIFGGADELLMLRKIELGKKSGGHDDSENRKEISEESTGPPPDKTSIKEESDWILNHLGTGMGLLFGKRDVEATVEGPEHSIDKDHIGRLLEFIHLQKLHVPFITTDMKEKCPSLFQDPQQLENKEDNNNTSDEKPTLRWHKVLWAIQDLDRKWLQLQKRKSSLQLSFKHLHEHKNYDYQFLNSIPKSVEEAVSDKELDDVCSKLNLRFPPGVISQEKGQYKRPSRKSQYINYRNEGLLEVAGKFGYSSEQFGLQISLRNMSKEVLEDAKETPEEIASRNMCKMFKTPQDVLKGARHMAAIEITSEPCVRKHVRSIFMDNAVVSTNPNPDVNVAISSYHEFAAVKRLKDKPLSGFEDAQWLLIQKAEEEKLIQVKIEIPESVCEKLISNAYDNYLSKGVSKNAELWNEQRKQILKDAFFGFLLPSMKKEARSLLTGRAKSWLLMEYGKLLWDKVSVAPHQKKDNDANSTDDYKGAPRVMACCWGPGKPTTAFVMLDSAGQLIDILYAGCLSICGRSVNDQQRTTKDQQHVVKFITVHQPHVIVLGAADSYCRVLKDDIDEIIKMVKDNRRDVGHKMDGLSIVYGDESLPRLYENSRISSDQLPSQPGIIKRAVGLGRYLQNPLAMAATLCGPEREILSWKFSPLESFFTPDEKYGIIEHIMVDVTNQVGLDVNLAARDEWLFAPLQFISGLGPRKAASLQRSLVGTRSVSTREALLSSHGLCMNMYTKEAGFLRVQQSGLELIQGFHDCRRQYVEPNPNESFLMIFGDTLAEGKIVKAKVINVKSERAMCSLESGLTAMLNNEDFSDDGRQHDLTEELKVGHSFICKIKNIQKNLYQVFLTCKDIEMRNDRFESNQIVDPHNREDPSNLLSEYERAQKELAKKHLWRRMIFHPIFQNITVHEAMEFLADKECGECVIRPSSRGHTFLTLTLKIYDGVYAHTNIIEGGKEHKDIINLLRLGKTLKIGEDTFEDLDEVMDRYVDSLVGHLKTMVSYRKFKKGTKAEIDEVLRIEKIEHPTRVVYCFGISHEYPGTFILTYIRSSDPHHEYIGLYPKGFKFREKMFDNIDNLVAYFQRHVDDPHDLAPSIRSQRGWGGSNSNEGGWRGGRGDKDGHPSGAPRLYGRRGRGR